jgi:UrcA family protein
MLRPVLLAFVALLVASGAQAEARRTVLTRVAVNDLDLQTVAGGQTLLRRLNAAANALCLPVRSALLPRAEARAYRCRRETVWYGVQRLNTPSLSKAYARTSAAPTTGL